nr:hypothetical protein [Klebsiella variicola]
MATASRFADEGFRVILSSRNKSNVAAQADQLRAAGFAAEGRAWRRRDPADWRDVCHSAPPGVSDVEHRQSRAA